MKKEKFPGSQPWMPLQTGTFEDPNMSTTPPGDYDLKAAQEDPDIARGYLQYIVEDRDQGKKLPAKAEDYLTHCLHELLDGKDPKHAFNLVGKKGRTKSTVERNIDMVGRYYARRYDGEPGKDIIEYFWEKEDISEVTFNEARRQHREFCEEHEYLWSEEIPSNIEKIERYEAGKILLAEYTEQCKSKERTPKPTR